MVTIQIFRQGEPIGTFFLTEDHLPTIIGRTDEAGVRIDDRAVSRRHAQLSAAGKKVVITDLGSGNGTYFGDRPVETKVIEHKDEATIGNYKLVFELTHKTKPRKTASPYDSIPEDDGHGMTMKMSKSAMREAVTRRAVEKPASIIQLSISREVPLRSCVCFIGSASVCDIIVTGWGVKPKHALVLRDGLVWRLYDLTGQQKVLVGGEGVHAIKLSAGMKFQIGKKHVFEFREGAETEELADDYQRWFDK